MRQALAKPGFSPYRQRKPMIAAGDIFASFNSRVDIRRYVEIWAMITTQEASAPLLRDYGKICSAGFDESVGRSSP